MMNRNSTFPLKREIRDTRELILESAKTVFAKKGFDGATVKDLSDIAGVNVSLISYYFKGKEGLYRACLESIGRSRIELGDRILRIPESPEDFRVRLKFYVESLIQEHLAEPEISTIVLRECGQETSIAADIYQTVFYSAYRKIVDFFVAAKEKKFLQPSIDPEISAFVIFGALMNAIRLDSMSEKLTGKTLKTPSQRDHFIQNLLYSVLDGVIVKENKKI